MSTWISERPARWLRAGTLAVVLPLAGCFGSDGGALGFLASGTGGEAEESAKVLRKIALYDGDVVVRGPRGYCIDRRSLRRREDGGFVLLASCESLSGLRGAGVEPVLITVAVLPDPPEGAVPAVPSADEIARSMAPAEVLTTHEEDALTLVHFASGGDKILPGGDARHWRGGMRLNGHLIALALYAKAESAMAGTAGRGLLAKVAGRMRRASPDRPAAAPTASDTGE